MDRSNVAAYIHENFNLCGEAYRLIDNILLYAEKIADESERYQFLCEMLDVTIGLSDREIRQFL